MTTAGILELEWMRCSGNDWCSLLDVDLNSPLLQGMGVYVIWTAWGRTIYVGQGIISERLEAHRSDPIILQFRDGGLWVTWATVPNDDTRNGVERYLADQLRPAVGSAYPQVFPLAVNLPR